MTSSALPPPDVVMFDGRQATIVAKRYGWLIILSAILGAVAGFGYSRFQPVLYEAQEQLIVTGQVSNPLVLDIRGGSPNAEQLVANQVAIIEGQALHQRVSERLGRDSPEVSAVAVNSSSVLLVSVRDNSVQAAEQTLGLYVDEYLAFIREQDASRLTAAQQQLESQISDYSQQLSGLEGPAAAAVAEQRGQVQGLLNQLKAAQAFGTLLVNSMGTPYAKPEPVSPRRLLAMWSGAATGALLGLALAGAANRRRRVDAAGPSMNVIASGRVSPPQTTGAMSRPEAQAAARRPSPGLSRSRLHGPAEPSQGASATPNHRR